MWARIRLERRGLSSPITVKARLSPGSCDKVLLMHSLNFLAMILVLPAELLLDSLPDEHSSLPTPHGPRDGDNIPAPRQACPPPLVCDGPWPTHPDGCPLFARI